MQKFEHSLRQAREAVIGDLRDIEIGEPFGLQLLGIFVRHCAEQDVTPSALLRFWQDIDDERHERAQQHAEQFRPVS